MKSLFDYVCEYNFKNLIVNLYEHYSNSFCSLIMRILKLLHKDESFMEFIPLNLLLSQF